MNFFLIEIGKYSRRGNFDKILQKVVAVPDDCYTPAVKNYFEGKYEGFNIRASRVEEVTDLSRAHTAVGHVRDDGVPLETEFYLHFDVKHTDREKEIFNEYHGLICKADEALRLLHRSIEDRLRALFYSGICNRRPLVMETDHNGTHCHKFPINGVRFESVAKNAEEDFTPESNPASPEAPAGENLPDTASGIENEAPVFDDVPF
jgi:hypothetical protein